VGGNFAQIIPLCNKEVTLDCDHSKIVSPDAGMGCFAMAHAEGFHSPPKQRLRYLVQIAKPPLRKLAEPMGTLPFRVKRVERK
jgi:hypothetical protein